MSTQFAGSRSSDDRRRRRLAQDAQDASARRGASTTRSAGVAAAAKSSTEKPPLPDESLIPRAPWKIALVAALGLILWAGTLWLGLAEWPRAHGLRQIGALADGTLPKLLTTGALLLAAQLSYLILWYRSRARKDFQGRYRIWGWSGLFWALTCLCVTTGLHLPASRILYEWYPLDCWRPELTYWLAPFAVGTLALYRLLGREMAHCRASTVCWHTAFAFGMLVGALELGGDLFLPAAQRVELVAAANTLWHGLITLTFLLHARFVVHVNNEAGPRRPNIPQRAWRLLLALAGLVLRVKWPARRPKKAKRAPAPTASRKKPTPVRKPVPAASDKEEEEAEPARKRVLGKSVRMDVPAAAPPAPHVPVTAPRAVATPPASRPASPAASKPTPTPQPAATRREEDQDRWLSKQERKKLQKTQR